MSTEISTETNNALIVSEKKLLSYLAVQGIAKGFSEAEKKQFIEIAQAYELNPFKREIYAIPYSVKGEKRLSIVTGYEVYLKRAERTGKLDGWNVKLEGNTKDTNNPLRAIVEIWRKDWNHSFKHEAYYCEAVGTNYKGEVNRMWAKMPRFMLKKVAVAQAFRLCFPDEFGGMPYTTDELPDEMTDTKNIKNVTETKEVVEEPRQFVDDDPDKLENISGIKKGIPAEGKEVKQEELDKMLTDRANEIIDYFKPYAHHFDDNVVSMINSLDILAIKVSKEKNEDPFEYLYRNEKKIQTAIKEKGLQPNNDPDMPLF